MTDKLTHQERLQGILHRKGSGDTPPKQQSDAEPVEASCGAFGYLRGIADKASAVELRLRSGERCYFRYASMLPWRYIPSEGILLKFSGDLFYLVLIRGSKLDMPLNEGAINLTSGGLQRERVVWVREMTSEDIKQIGEKGPTIESIEIAELETKAAVKEWISKNAPAFVR
jgi:hypothetical protein